MSETGAANPTVVGAAGPSGVMDDHILCSQCLYNLRGLPTDGRCPECGSAVSESINRNLIYDIPLDQARTVYLGLNGLSFSIRFMMAIFLAGLAGLVLTDAYSHRSWESLASLTLNCVLAWAWWWMFFRGTGSLVTGNTEKDGTKATATLARVSAQAGIMLPVGMFLAMFHVLLTIAEKYTTGFVFDTVSLLVRITGWNTWVFNVRLIAIGILAAGVSMTFSARHLVQAGEKVVSGRLARNLSLASAGVSISMAFGAFAFIFIQAIEHHNHRSLEFLQILLLALVMAGFITAAVFGLIMAWVLGKARRRATQVYKMRESFADMEAD